jgi:hypothetical protein
MVGCQPIATATSAFKFKLKIEDGWDFYHSSQSPFALATYYILFEVNP